jgi:hypothetical protein
MPLVRTPDIRCSNAPNADLVDCLICAYFARMQSLRSPFLRAVLVWAILPAYLLLLSADRNTDGGFARWLDLTLSTHLGKSFSTQPSDAGFNLVIGEWKQFKQVNTSTTPAEQTELRDTKLMQRLTASTSFFDGIESIEELQKMALRVACRILEDNIHQSKIFPPLISGIAIGAP